MTQHDVEHNEFMKYLKTKRKSKKRLKVEFEMDEEGNFYVTPMSQKWQKLIGGKYIKHGHEWLGYIFAPEGLYAGRFALMLNSDELHDLANGRSVTKIMYLDDLPI